jgi:hypothetical protein
MKYVLQVLLIIAAFGVYNFTKQMMLDGKWLGLEDSFIGITHFILFILPTLILIGIAKFSSVQSQNRFINLLFYIVLITGAILMFFSLLAILIGDTLLYSPLLIIMMCFVYIRYFEKFD